MCMRKMRVPIRWKFTAGFLTASGDRQTLDNLAAVWRSWSEQVRPQGQSVSWADVKGNIVLKLVAAPSASDTWEIHETSLILMERNRGVQRSFFRTTDFDTFGEKQFGPPITKSDGYDLVTRILEAFSGDEMKVMGEIVEKAKHRRPTGCHDGPSAEQDRLSIRRRKRCPGCNVAGAAG